MRTVLSPELVTLQDLAEARRFWLSEAKNDSQAFTQREGSDFPADANHEGEIIDFHSLQHTCVGWLAMTGAHPKVVQQMMRQQSIMLTMDTYGHLFPGQEADAVGRLREMLVDHRSDPDALRATGTGRHGAESPKGAQRAGRETLRSAATPCDQSTSPAA